VEINSPIETRTGKKLSLMVFVGMRLVKILPHGNEDGDLILTYDEEFMAVSLGQSLF
jgi:hypothetical protein